MTANERLESNTMNTMSWERDSAQIKRKLAWRMGIAGLMIVALLSGLALFDYLAALPDETETPPHFTDPIPVSKKSMTQASGPVEPAPDEGMGEPGIEELIPSVPELTETPVNQTTQTTADIPMPPPEAAAADPVTRPASARPAPTASTVSTASPTPSTPPVRRTETRKRPAETAFSRPKAPETEVPSVPASTRPPVLTRLLSGYTLQAGVFADPRRAEEIHAKLVQEGIPATLETRVLVGPFKDRNAAESARAKMKAMGIDALPVLRSGKR